MTYTITEKQFEAFADKLCDIISVILKGTGLAIKLNHKKAVQNIKTTFEEYTQ